MKQPTKPITAFLSENDVVAPVLSRARRISHLQNLFAESLAECGQASLVTCCRVASESNSTLVVAAANAACAAILKQMTPRLTENFQGKLARKSENQMQEQQVTSIQVILQPDQSLWQDVKSAPKKPVAPHPGVSNQRLADFADKIGDSPLKDAILRIQRRRKQALTKRG